MFKFEIKKEEKKDDKIELIVALERIDKVMNERSYADLYCRLESLILDRLADEYIRNHREEVIAKLDMKALANITLARVARKIGDGY